MTYWKLREVDDEQYSKLPLQLRSVLLQFQEQAGPGQVFILVSLKNPYFTHSNGPRLEPMTAKESGSTLT